MVKVLLAYTTRNGSTAEIAGFMKDILTYHRLEVTLADVERVSEVKSCDAFVLGSPVYSGMWLPAMHRFLRQFEEDMRDKPVYCWMTCIRVLEEGGTDHALTNYAPDSLLQNLNVRQMTAFAGKLKWAEVNWNDRWTLALQYDGKTDVRNYNSDHRDWNIIRHWSVKLAEDIKIYHGLL